MRAVTPHHRRPAEPAAPADRAPVAYASPDALPTGLLPTVVAQLGRSALRLLPGAALLAAAAWACLWYVTARSDLRVDLPLGFCFEIGEERFRLDPRGPPIAAGDALLPLAALLAVPPAVIAARAVRRLARAGRSRRGVFHGARRPLFALAVVLAFGAEGWWVRLPPPPVVTWLPPDEAVLADRADRVRAADVAADVRAALNRGDRRLLGIGGEGGGRPAGVDDYWPRRAWYDQQFGVRHFADATDCIEPGQAARLQSVTWDYARRYNRLLLARAAPIVVGPVATTPGTAPASGATP